MSLGLFASLSLVLNVQPRESLARLQIAPGHHQPGPHPEGSPRHRRGGVLPCLPRPPAHFLLNTPTESQRIPSDWARGYPLVQLNYYPLTIFSFPHCKTPPVSCAKSQPRAAESSREQPRAAESSREQPRAAGSRQLRQLRCGTPNQPKSPPDLPFRGRPCLSRTCVRYLAHCTTGLSLVQSQHKATHIPADEPHIR
jgi:hypothetical protein